MKRGALAGVLAAAGLLLWLGTRGLGWGIVTAPSGAVFLLQPDEGPNVAAATHPSKSVWLWQEKNLRPYYLKGQLYYSELRTLAWAASPWFASSSRRYYLLARAFSLAQALGALLLAALLAWRLLGPAAAAWTALLLAVCPGFVAYAHYMSQDTGLAFWTMAVLLLGVEASRGRRGPAAAAALGACAALATATKHSGWTLALPAALALRRASGRERLAAFAAFFLVLGAADPILWSEPALVRKGAAMLAENNRHGIAYCAARLPGWLDYAVSVLPYAMGAPLALLALSGLPWLAAAEGAGPLLAWAALYWTLLGFDNVRLLRYTVPLLPLLCLAAAGLPSALGRFHPRAKDLGWAALALAFCASFLGSAAYTAAMRLPDPRLRAFQWFLGEVPAPASIAVPELSFANVPTPPGGQVRSAGWDWELLKASGAPWAAVSDFEALPYQEAAASYPKEAAFLSRLESGGEFKKAAEFENPACFWGWCLKKGRPPHDWLYPNAKITVYRRLP